jgi:hypothetical protein
MRLLASILMLALAIFPASGGFAQPAAHAVDCQHESAMPVAGHDHHNGSSTIPAETAAFCCLLHCVAVTGTFVGPILAANSSPATPFQRADERSAGMTIEPAIPPPRG